MHRRSLLISLLASALVPGLGCRRAGEPKAEQRPPGESPERIASRTVFADELLWALGPEVRARVVAVSPMADDARYSTVAGEWSAEVPRLGRNPEELLVLGPDLVILASFSAPEYRAAVEDKVPVLVLEDFTGFAGYLDNLARIGEALGAVDAAQKLRARFVERRAALEARRPPEGRRPSIASWDRGYMPGAGTSFDDAARSAGFVNVAARAGLEGHQRVDAEQLVAWDPQWMVVGCGARPCAEAIANLAKEPGIGQLAAVREGRVIAIEAPYLATTGEAMLELAARMQAPLLAAKDPAKDPGP